MDDVVENKLLSKRDINDPFEPLPNEPVAHDPLCTK
jgi:hypothetical protein